MQKYIRVSSAGGPIKPKNTSQDLLSDAKIIEYLSMMRLASMELELSVKEHGEMKGKRSSQLSLLISLT
jgi:hypothetical protein